MNDNEFNNNPNDEKDPWEDKSESTEQDTNTGSQPEANEETGSTQDIPTQETSQWKDINSDSADSETGSANQTEQAGQPEPTSQSNPYQQPGQYQNPQNPYSPYGQYHNPYGQYNNPYGQYRNPYANYGNYNNSYGGGQNPYNPYNQQNPQNPQNQNPQNQQNQQPYWSYNQYGQNPQNQPPRPPRKRNTGLTVFLAILGVLIAGSIISFITFGVYTASEQKNGENITSSQEQPNYGGDNNSTPSGKPQIEGNAPGNGTNPNSSGIVINPIPAGGQKTARQIYKDVVESVVGVKTQQPGADSQDEFLSQGTGIIATSDGYILTNAHVLEYSRANKVTVMLHSGKDYAATVVGYDKTSDIAVLKINATNLAPATFGDADQLEVGDQVFAIGNPGGMSYASSLTGGLVSALNRSIESHSDNGMTYIQTDAAINPGNSGGPLVNIYGQVVAINSNKIVSAGYEGMGFSIPISKAKTIIDDLVMHGYVSGRSRLGITAQTITDIQSQLSGYPTGVIIREITPESDLNKSKVVVGDIITQADGKKIASLEDLYAVLNKHKAGDMITLTIFVPGTTQSNSTTRTVKTKLLEDKGETQTK
jgi:serine protease Do